MSKRDEGDVINPGSTRPLSETPVRDFRARGMEVREFFHRPQGTIDYTCDIGTEEDLDRGRTVRLFAYNPQAALKSFMKHLRPGEAIRQIAETNKRPGVQGWAVVYDYWNGFLE